MKAIIFLTVSLMGYLSQAQENPLIRACNLNGAQVHIYQTSKQPYDEQLFCDFGSGAMIDAQSLIQKQEGTLSSAAKTFVNSSTCTEGEGTTVNLTDAEKQSATFCRFNDNSYISLQALSSRNPRLLQALTN